MKFVAMLIALTMPAVAMAQNPLQPALPSLPLASVAAPSVQSSVYEPTLYCLYNGIPYSRGSRLYQGGFAMSCDLVANNPGSLVWQLVR